MEGRCTFARRREGRRRLKVRPRRLCPSRYHLRLVLGPAEEEGIQDVEEEEVEKNEEEEVKEMRLTFEGFELVRE